MYLNIRILSHNIHNSMSLQVSLCVQICVYKYVYAYRAIFVEVREHHGNVGSTLPMMEVPGIILSLS